MEQLYGIFLYAVFLLTMGGIYAVLTLGLNIQWGFTGLFNAGVAGFFAIGAYTTAIVSTVASERHLGWLRPAGGGGHGRRDDRERGHRLGRGPDLHSPPRRLPRDRHSRNRRDLPARPQERSVGDQRPARDLSHPEALRAPRPAVEPCRDAAAGLRGGRRALRPARTGAAFPLGTGDGRNPRERGGGARGGKGRRAPAQSKPSSLAAPSWASAGR